MTNQLMTNKYRTGFDLEERTKQFAVGCKKLVKAVNNTAVNTEYTKQLIRSSGSVAANYIEANERLSKADFNFRIKICRKEAKESRLWLELIDCSTSEQEKERRLLSQEATELLKIFSAIVSRI